MLTLPDLGLEPVIAADRRSYIGSSDAKDILEGRWRKPWALKTGAAEPEDLSRVFKVQLGVHTEPFHVAWVLARVRETGELPDFDAYADQFLVSAELPYAASHPDQLLEPADETGEIIPMEVKHGSGRMSTEDALAYYMAQLQHHIFCAGAKRLLFSIIHGNQDPVHIWVGRSEEWIAAIRTAYPAFWHHVTTGLAPADQPYDLDDAPLAPPPSLDGVPLNGLTARDASGDNQWGAYAADFIDSMEAAKRHEASKKALKDLIKPTEREVYCPRLSVKRDARGALRFTVKGA